MSVTNQFLTSFPCLIFFFLQISYAWTNNPHHCTPSSCSTIHNITYPFRLTQDPLPCGRQNYELVCEANTTLFLYLDSHKYFVKAINYNNHTIHLADASILPNRTCSFPNHSLSLTKDSPYSTEPLGIQEMDRPVMITPLTFLSCPSPLNSSRFVRADVCRNTSSESISYIKVGYSNLGEMCSQEMVAMTSMRFRNPDRVSLAEIHGALVYGFELSWFSARCPTCRGDAICWIEGDMCQVITCTSLSEGGMRCEMGTGLGLSQLVLGIFAYIFTLLFYIIGLSIVVRIVIGLPALLLILIHRHRTRSRNAAGKSALEEGNVEMLENEDSSSPSSLRQGV